MKDTLFLRVHKYWFWLYIFFFIITIIGFSFYLFNTFFSRFVNPFHFYKVSEKKFNRVVEDLVVLEKKVDQNDKYISLLQKIIRENNIIDISKNEVVDEIKFSDSGKKESTNSFIDVSFVSPVKGDIIENLSLDRGNKKIFIRGKNNSQVLSILDGTILSILKKERELSKVIILHQEGIVSVYHCKNIIVTENEKVSSGHVIGFLGPKENGRSYNFIFEMFFNSQPVLAEDYINF